MFIKIAGGDSEEFLLTEYATHTTPLTEPQLRLLRAAGWEQVSARTLLDASVRCILVGQWSNRAAALDSLTSAGITPDGVGLTVECRRS